MSQEAIYQKFIEWLGKTWWQLPESDQLLPLIKARYTPEEAEFLTGFPFSGRSLEELSDLKSTKKQKSIVIPRQICMYLARHLTKMSYPEIGARLGGKDHSTIIYAVKKIEKASANDKQIKTAVDTLINKLNKP